jgi:hypothetical protein
MGCQFVTNERPKCGRYGKYDELPEVGDVFWTIDYLTQEKIVK